MRTDKLLDKYANKGISVPQSKRVLQLFWERRNIVGLPCKLCKKDSPDSGPYGDGVHGVCHDCFMHKWRNQYMIFNDLDGVPEDTNFEKVFFKFKFEALEWVFFITYPFKKLWKKFKKRYTKDCGKCNKGSE